MALGSFLSLGMAAAFLRVMYKPGQIKYVIWGSIWSTVIVTLILALFFYREYQSVILCITSALILYSRLLRLGAYRT